MNSAYQNLGEFIFELERAGELLRVGAPVSSDLEITHITDLMSKARSGRQSPSVRKCPGIALSRSDQRFRERTTDMHGSWDRLTG